MNPSLEIYYEVEDIFPRTHPSLPNIIRDKATSYVGLSELTSIPMILVNTHRFKFGIAIEDLQILLAQPIVQELLDHQNPDRTQT
jgi:hypothetical protein